MKINYIFYLSITILTIGCKTIQLPIERALLPMPDKFATQTDSTNKAKKNWKDFFKDKYLIALIDTALQNNLDVLTAYQNIQITKASLLYNKGLLKPTVTANLGAGITKYGNYTQEWAGNKTTEIVDGKIIPQHLPDFLIGFSSNWEVDIWGKLKNKKQAAQARYLASVEGKNWLVTNLIAEVASNYYVLMALDKQTEILKNSIILQEQFLAVTKVLKEGNKTNEFAVKQFEAQILNAKVSTTELTENILNIESNINLLLGRYPQSIKRNTIDIDNWLVQKISEGIPSQLLQNRSDIRAAEQVLIASRADINAAKAAFYPSFSIGGRLGLQGYSSTLLFSAPSIAYNLLGGIVAPLLNKSAIKAEFNTASALQLTALYNYQETVLTAFTEVYTQMKSIALLDEIIDLKKQEVAVLSSAIKFSDLLFQNNRINYLEVLVAQSNLLQAKLDLLQNCKQQQQVNINLYKSVGGGW
ncbi:MAG: TolC family protein [Sphingobacteriia bacterium]|nr:MAG: TolC family protein [Sphingobacteriia bacterium]TAG31636.1 MAG: TolC family protein [Sphingobacteriia bacterium]